MRGTGEAAIRRLFQPGTLRWFAEHPGWSVESIGGWCLLYRHGRRVKPEELPDVLGETERIVSMLSLS